MGIGACLLLLLSFEDAAAQTAIRQSSLPIKRSRPSADTPELARSRAEVLQKIRETRAGAEKLLALHENERQRRADEYQRQRELYHQGLVARNEVLQAERSLAEAMLKVDEDKRWIAETDSALTEVTMRDELLGLPSLGLGGYSETHNLLRFNGASLWRLAEVSKVEKFFVATFGCALPISALGQTATHDRLRC